MSVHPAVRAALGGFDPTPEQAAAIEHPPGPVAIVAGAGSGKTAVMAARVAHLVVSGAARPSSILGLTFTNKAAAELDERMRRSLEHLDLPPGEEVAVFTYHGFADRLLRDFGPKIGLEPEVALLSEAQRLLLIERLFAEITFDRLRVTYLPSLVSKVRSLAEACANHLVTPEAVAVADDALVKRYEDANKKLPAKLKNTLHDRPEICRVVRAYVDRKAALGRIDYGDQIAFAYKLVTERSEVAAALAERWPVVLLDEYQDTNVAQRKMMQAIYGEGAAITVVGDPDQAIYAWRGATLYNILRFPEHFEPARGRTLQRSFRSGRRILRAADAVISAIPKERRGGDKVLEHHPDTGEGEVTCDLFASDVDEAASIAVDVKKIAGEDGEGLFGRKVPFGEVAVLCRKRRLFHKIQQALRDEGIPVEVVGLGGLLAVPEVIDVLAYVRLVATPSDNVAFARVAMGPRWRIGPGDMAVLARWAAANTGDFQDRLKETLGSEDEVDPGEERFSLSEALDHVDAIEDLSDEAAARLRRLRADLEAMRAAVRGATLVEAIERILDISGVEEEIAAHDTPVAAAARANLGSFLDHAGEFSPLEGEATIAAFLEYLEVARSSEDLEIAQPQMDDAVKLMTVHQAKGLEFDLVFVPGLAKDIFPDDKVTDNPLSAQGELPYSVREDRESLPEFDVGTPLKAFNDALKERAMEDERRLAYVAFTRARKALRISAAHWYGIDYERKTPNGPGLFLAELTGPLGDHAGEEHDAPEGAPLPEVTVRTRAECPETNPLIGELARRAESWPPAAADASDDLLPAGWRSTVEDALSDDSVVERLVDRAGVARTDFERERGVVGEQLQIVTAPPAPTRPDDRLTSLSVSAVVQLARCPKQFYWTVVRPLPRRPSAGARLGQEIHRWIELRSIGQGRLDDPEDGPDLTPEELEDEPPPTARAPGPRPATADDLKRAFETSRFASLSPRYTEQAFSMPVGDGYLVRGRIDAVYVHPGGRWEIVDFKTGREPDAGDPNAGLQLAVYALAARRIWGVDPENLDVTYLYLSTGRAATTRATDIAIGEDFIASLFETARGEDFEPRPSRMCHSCDFVRFCPEGREFRARRAL